MRALAPLSALGAPCCTPDEKPSLASDAFVQLGIFAAAGAAVGLFTGPILTSRTSTLGNAVMGGALGSFAWYGFRKIFFERHEEGGPAPTSPQT